MVRNASTRTMNASASASSPVPGTTRITRSDSGFADADFRKSIDRPSGSHASTKRNSHSTHGSRQSSRSSVRPSASQFAGDSPRHQRPKLHSYKSSASSQRANTEELHALYTRSCAIMRCNSTPSGGFSHIPPPAGVASSQSSIRSQPISITSTMASVPHHPMSHNAHVRVDALAFANPWAPTYAPTMEPEPPATEPVPIEVIAPTTMHWLTPETRAKQYAEIERSCKGWRGFLKKATRSEKKARQTQDHLIDFYDENKGDDAASVRRYRIDTDDEDEEKENDIPQPVADVKMPKGRRKGWLGGRR